MDSYLTSNATMIGDRVRAILIRLRILDGREEDLVYVWPRADRAVVILDPISIRNIDRLFSDRTRHHLQTALNGRRVVFTNSRCAAIQVGWMPEPAASPREIVPTMQATPPRPVELVSAPVDWSRQPSALHVPIGMTAGGPMWLSIDEMQAVLIGGATRMGKSTLLHQWIEALSRGSATRLVLWDGADNVEFGRYHGRANVEVVTDLAAALASVVQEVQRRKTWFLSTGASSLAQYNRTARDRLLPIVVVIDECAFVPAEAQPVVADLAARAGKFGVHLLMATQLPDAKAMQAIVRTNLATRIAFPVPSTANSLVILGQSGAQRLAKRPGRLLLNWQARLIEAQAFQFEPAAMAPLPDALRQRFGANLAPSTAQMVETAETVLSHLPQPVAPVAPVAPTALGTLTADELRMVDAALVAGGWFRTRAVADATRISHHLVEAAARRWQVCGWLTAVQRDDAGRPLGRRVTNALIEASGLQSTGLQSTGTQASAQIDPPRPGWQPAVRQPNPRTDAAATKAWDDGDWAGSGGFGDQVGSGD